MVCELEKTAAFYEEEIEELEETRYVCHISEDVWDVEMIEDYIEEA